MKRSKWLLILLLICVTVSVLNAGWFELGKPRSKPFQIETSLTYEENKEYYDDIEKKMLPFPEDWEYTKYEFKLKLGLYLANNLRVRFSIPYKYIKKLKFSSSDKEDFATGQAWVNYEFDISYTFFSFKQGLLGFLKRGSINTAFIFDNGSDEDLEHYLSMGRNEIDNSLTIDMYMIPESWDLYLHKYLIFKLTGGYTFSGKIRSDVPEYSSSGYDNGDSYDYGVRISYQINKYFKTDVIYSYSYSMADTDLTGQLEEDDDSYEGVLETSLKWKVYGKDGIELGLSMEYPLFYKSSYVSFFNPEVSLKFSF